MRSRRTATIRVVILAANGPAFCAGHDLKELTARRSDPDGGKAYFRHIMTICSAMMQKIVALPQPVIACVSGVATAAGCQLVATCDLAVASQEAKFATPGVDIGLFCSTPMVALTRNIPRKNAMHMLLTGEPVTAEDAARMGLINRAVTAGSEYEAALELARRIASKSKATVKIGKQAFYRQAELRLGAGLCLCERSHDREHDDARRQRRHLRLHRKAQTAMGGSLSAAFAIRRRRAYDRRRTRMVSRSLR